MWETWVQSLGWEDPLEEGMATHFSILAWRIPWTEQPGGVQFIGSQRVGHNWATKHSTVRCGQAGRFGRIWLCMTLWTVVHKTPLSMGFSRQEYWSGLPCPLPGDLLNPGVEPAPLMLPALGDGFFSATWEVLSDTGDFLWLCLLSVSSQAKRREGIQGEVQGIWSLNWLHVEEIS